MYYIVESEKSFSDAATDLDEAIVKHGFGVLHIHDLGMVLRNKGFAFNEDCKIFEICNPTLAEKVLAIDMHLIMALPCRISVFTEIGKTKIGLIKPIPMLTALSQNTALIKIAEEVERATIRMVNEAK